MNEWILVRGTECKVVKCIRLAQTIVDSVKAENFSRESVYHMKNVVSCQFESL